MNLLQIGELFKHRRTFLSIRQEDLSEMSGINVRTIQQIELGKANPSFDTLEKLAGILGLEIIVQVKREPVYGCIRPRNPLTKNLHKLTIIKKLMDYFFSKGVIDQL